jgi:NADH-quinone oxidoreductase subunit G
VNQQFRLQKFQKAVPGVAGATDDLVVLAKLATAAGATSASGDLNHVWQALAASVPALGTATFATIPESGLLLDGMPFAALPFIEGETLHYKPAAKTTAA